MQVKKCKWPAVRRKKQAAAPRTNRDAAALVIASRRAPNKPGRGGFGYCGSMARQGSSRVTRVPKPGLLCTRMQLDDPA